MTTRGTFGHVRALDGLRAVSILLVLGQHGLGPITGHTAARFAGWAGVDVFFVISGFLITSLLLAEEERTGTFSLRAFYLRRVLRIAPAYTFFLAAMLLWLGWRAAPAVGMCLVYLSDYGAAFQYSGMASILGITWSLSVEEQFYLFWPLTMRLVSRRALPVSLGCIVLVIAWRGFLVVSGTTWQRLYFSFDTRVDAILIGCAAAMLWRRFAGTGAQAWLARTTPVAVLLFVFSAFNLHYFAVRGVSFWCFQLPLHHGIVALFIVSVVAAPRALVSRGLASRPMVFVGRLSYSLYLWHLFAIDRVHAILGPLVEHATAAHPALGGEVLELATIAASLGLASASFYLIEKPFLRLKDRRGQAAGDSIAAAAAPQGPTVESPRAAS